MMSKWNRIKSILASRDGPFVVSYLLMNSMVVFWVLLAVGIFIDAMLFSGRFAWSVAEKQQKNRNFLCEKYQISVDSEPEIRYNTYMNSNKQESIMNTDFDMYTDAGDVVAQKIVELSQAANLDWPQTQALMRFIADQKSEQYGELMDTAVREVVYARRGFKTSFYS